MEARNPRRVTFSDCLDVAHKVHHGSHLCTNSSTDERVHLHGIWCSCKEQAKAQLGCGSVDAKVQVYAC